MKNADPRTVEGFGHEWAHFDQSEMSDHERAEMFGQYFASFPWDSISSSAVGIDVGCGSGRWAELVAPRVGTLHCVDASPAALEIARRNLSVHPNCMFHLASVSDLPLDDGAADFGYCLGVLHHVPDTFDGLREIVRTLKPGAPLLVYIYYAFDNKPGWYRMLYRISNGLRQITSRLPHALKIPLANVIALTIYLPLARAARMAEKVGADVAAFPLSWYRHRSFYTMRTDALDRFGTRLEKRFSLQEIRSMMERAGLERLVVSPEPPHWCVLGYRSKTQATV
jgi:ubiquinone/menaquinone biosynthesis C-methylase UbiE